jgi:hypothetical protein
VATLLWLGPLAAQQLVNRVVARVGSDAITQTDLRASLGLGIVEALDEDEGLQQLIDRRLQLLEVDRLTPIEPSPETIETEVERMKSYAGTGLTRLLEATGITEARLPDIARDTLRIRAYLESRFPFMPVNDSEAEQYYRAHPEAFRRNGVLMSFDEAAPAARAAMTAERRNARIAQWLRDRRARVDVVILKGR